MDRKGRRVCKAPKVIQGTQARKVHKAHKVQPVRKVRQARAFLPVAPLDKP